MKCEKLVAAGQKKEKIYYSAAGKSMEDIESTMESAVLIADSIEEIKRIQFAAKHRNLVVEIGIRINPNFSFTKMRECLLSSALMRKRR